MADLVSPLGGRRKRGSATVRMLEYFEANPDEELTVNDVAKKFGISEASVRMVFYRGVAELEYAKVIRAKRTR